MPMVQVATELLCEMNPDVRGEFVKESAESKVTKGQDFAHIPTRNGLISRPTWLPTTLDANRKTKILFWSSACTHPTTN